MQPNVGGKLTTRREFLKQGVALGTALMSPGSALATVTQSATAAISGIAISDNLKKYIMDIVHSEFKRSSSRYINLNIVQEHSPFSYIMKSLFNAVEQHGKDKGDNLFYYAYSLIPEFSDINWNEVKREAQNIYYKEVQQLMFDITSGLKDNKLPAGIASLIEEESYKTIEYEVKEIEKFLDGDENFTERDYTPPFSNYVRALCFDTLSPHHHRISPYGYAGNRVIPSIFFTEGATPYLGKFQKRLLSEINILSHMSNAKYLGKVKEGMESSFSEKITRNANYTDIKKLKEQIKSVEKQIIQLAPPMHGFTVADPRYVRPDGNEIY